MGITRRDLLKASAAGAVLTGLGLPTSGMAAQRKTVRIGILAPFTGPTAGWGLPGLYGLEIHAQQINEAGGVMIDGEPYNIEIVSYDSEYSPAKALQGYKQLVAGKGAKLVMMLGGNTWPAVHRYAHHVQMLTTTLLPSDLTPNTPYLIAPAEVHPMYVVTGVDWMAQHYPEYKTVAMCAQNDSLGLPSLSTYEAAIQGAGLDLVKENVFSPGTTDFAPIVSSLMSANPDVISLDTSYPNAVNLMCQQLNFQGYEGQIISATCDSYNKIINKTSKEFMSGVIFQFPDFDDPKMQEPNVNFYKPLEFWKRYNNKHPGAWTAVSWEYPSILDVWKLGAEAAGSVEPMDVLETLKARKTVPAIWGETAWWGKELWGIDNALVGNWPVVQINDQGKARIQKFGSILDWYDKHGDLLIKKMKKRDLLA